MTRQSIITSAEKLFKTDIRYVGKNGFWVTFGQAVTVGLGLVVSVAFANLLPPHEYGVYKYILAIAGLLGALRLTGLQQAATQAVARGFDSTILRAIHLSLRWSSIPLVVASVIAMYYFIHDNNTLALGIIAATVSTLSIGSIGLYGSYLVGKQQFKTSTLHYIALTLGNTITLLLTLLLTDNVLYIIAANSFSTIIILFALALPTLRQVDRTTETSEKSIRFGKHLSFQNVFLLGAMHLDKVILFQWVGSIELARYAFAIMLPEQLKSVSKNVINIIIPKYATKEDVALRKSIKQKSLQLTMLILVPIGFYILIAPVIFKFLFPVYVDVVFYSQIAVLSLLFLPTSTLLLAYFHVQEQTKNLYYIKIIDAIGKVSFLLIGVFYFGVLGAIGAIVATRLFILLVFLWHFYFAKPTHGPVAHH